MLAKSKGMETPTCGAWGTSKLYVWASQHLSHKDYMSKYVKSMFNRA